MSALIVKQRPSDRLFKKINGLISIYKPPSMELGEIVDKLKYTFVSKINEMPCRPIEKIVKIDEETDQVYIAPNLADSPLGMCESVKLIIFMHLFFSAVGPRFIRKDFQIEFLHPLSVDASGVQSKQKKYIKIYFILIFFCFQVCAINDTHEFCKRVYNMRLMKVSLNLVNQIFFKP